MRVSTGTRAAVSLRTAGNWAIVSAGLASAQGLTALAVILTARRIPPTEYGQYISSYALASLLVVVPGYGLDAWLLWRGGADRARLPALWRSALRLRYRLLAAWLVCITILGIAVRTDSFPPILLSLAALGLAADSLSLLSYSALRALGSHKCVAIYQSSGAAGLLGTALALPSGPGAVALFAAARALLSTLLATITVRSVTGRLPQSASPAPPGAILREAVPFVLTDLAVSVYMRADLILVSSFLGAAGSSVYGPAVNLVNVSFLAPGALYLIMMPKLAQTFGKDDRMFRYVAAAQLIVHTFTGIAVAGTLYVTAEILIEALFGPAYSPSAALLQLLSPLVLFKSLSFGLAALLTAARRHRWRTSVQVVVAVFNVVANLAVVTRIGLPGVALVYVASELLLCAGYGLGAYRWQRDRRGQGSASCSPG